MTFAEFWTDYLWPLIIIVAESLLLLVVLLVAIAYVLLADRKIWAAVQIRRGPNVVGPWGLFQSFADLLKFVFKEPTIPAGANKGVFLLAPLISCLLSLSAWAVIPVAEGWSVANINVGVLYLFAISSLGVYGIIIAGWASNSKYAFLGALRSAAQMISYEVSMGLIIIGIILSTGTPEYTLPPTVGYVQEQLGLEKVSTMELRSAGAGAVSIGTVPVDDVTKGAAAVSGAPSAGVP